MKESRIGVAREGAPAIALAAFATIACALLDWPVPTVVLFLLTAFCGHFFRDPERVTPHEKDCAVSPADGKIIRREARVDPFSGEQRLCISIFMNVCNVHVNRAPVAGTVADVRYHPGLFFNASLDKASPNNERCSMLLRGEDGAPWTVVQIAGFVARRIVFRAEIGDTLQRGERFGMIRFGSRLDLYLPDGYSPAVFVGDKVLAGQTILARRDVPENAQ